MLLLSASAQHYDSEHTCLPASQRLERKMAMRTTLSLFIQPSQTSSEAAQPENNPVAPAPPMPQPSTPAPKKRKFARRKKKGKAAAAIVATAGAHACLPASV